MNITLKYADDRRELLELGTLLALDEGTITARAALDLIVCFAMDGDGEYLPEKEARELAVRLRLEDLRALFDTFRQAVIQDAIPPTISSASKARSGEAEQGPGG